MIKYRLFLLGIVLGIISIIEICYLVNKQSSLVAIIFAIGTVVIAGIPILKNTLQALKSLSININVLMLLAIIGALFLHDFIEAAMIVVLFNISEVIEDYSISVAKASVTSLFELVPKKARLWNVDNWQIVVTNKIAVGDTIRVLPTEKIPVDGVVISGVSGVNQAQITGESVPVTKAEGDTVYAGSINDNGVLDIVATSIAKESTVAKIIKLIEEVQQVQAPTQKIIDRFAKYYTPIIFVIALGYAVIPPLWFGQDFQEYVYRSLLLLVISCPCALVISIPVAVINGLIVAAKNGIIIKGGIHLENGYRLKSIAFDKTGTLTKGEQSIETVVAFQNPQLANILQIAGSISQYSLHPIARAIFAHSQTQSDDLLTVKDFKEIVGGGTSGVLNGVQYYLGNHKFIHNRHCNAGIESHIQDIEATGQTVIVLATDSEVLGMIGITDKIRSESVSAIKRLQELGVASVLVTGDNKSSAELIANIVGIDQVYSSMLPIDKANIIDELIKKYSYVGMVGDGVNDALAFAKSTISFAMGQSGVDIALETADVIIMDNNLTRISQFIGLSKKVKSVLKQNITFSISVKLIFFVLAIVGMTNLWLSMFADVGVGLLVIFNGLRIRRL